MELLNYWAHPLLDYTEDSCVKFTTVSRGGLLSVFFSPAEVCWRLLSSSGAEHRNLLLCKNNECDGKTSPWGGAFFSYYPAAAPQPLTSCKSRKKRPHCLSTFPYRDSDDGLWRKWSRKAWVDLWSLTGSCSLTSSGFSFTQVLVIKFKSAYQQNSLCLFETKESKDHVTGLYMFKNSWSDLV